MTGARLNTEAFLSELVRGLGIRDSFSCTVYIPREGWWARLLGLRRAYVVRVTHREHSMHVSCSHGLDDLTALSTEEAAHIARGVADVARERALTPTDMDASRRAGARLAAVLKTETAGALTLALLNGGELSEGDS